MKLAAKMICQNKISSKRRIIRVFLAGGLLSCLLILFFVQPANLPFAGCAFYSITGHSCMTCGMTRSLHAISHGDLSASFRYHLLGPAVFIGILLCFLIFTAQAASGMRLAVQPGKRIKSQMFILFAAVWLLYWGVRIAAECLA
jgi:hypothetical protein